MDEYARAVFVSGDIVGTEIWFGGAVGGRKRGTVLHLSGPHAVRVKDHKTGKPRTVPLTQVELVDPPAPTAPELTTVPSFEAAELRGVPKDLPVRSKKYLDYIRAKECRHCGKLGRSQAAHYGGAGASGGMGTKASDLFTVPLCAACHGHYHHTGHLPGGTPETTRRDHIRWERDLLAEFIAGGGVL